MNTYGQENEFNWSLSSMVGGFLIVTSVGVLLWVVISLFLLFTDSSAFFVLEEIVPAKIILADVEGSELLFPRELLIFGIPVWALSVGTRIGIVLLKNGVKLAEKTKKKT